MFSHNFNSTASNDNNSFTTRWIYAELTADPKTF